MSGKQLKGAIIGAGFFADFQAEAWQRIPVATITAVVDPLADRAQAFAARWNIPQIYADAETMLRVENPDFVDIATRPDSHLSLVELVAAQGAQVICQKPMAPTWEESVRMVEFCQRAKVRLLIHENWRWQAWYREIKKLIEHGLFGRIFHLGFCLRSGDGRGRDIYPAQPYFKEMPRLLIYETLVHFLDTFRFLSGEIETVFCQTRRINPLILGEDYAVIQVGFVNGAYGLIDANRISGPVPPDVAFGVFTLEGERAKLRMTSQGDLFITEYGQPEILHHYQKPEQGYKGDSVKAAQVHYADCLLTGKKCESEGAEYLKTVSATFACYESNELRRIVNLD